MKIERPSKACYKLVLNTKETIDLIGKLANAIGTQGVRYQNRLLSKETGALVAKNDDGVHVAAYFNDKPERTVRICLEDLPIEDTS